MLAVLLVLLFVGGVALLRSESTSAAPSTSTPEDDVTLPTAVPIPPASEETAPNRPATPRPPRRRRSSRHRIPRNRPSPQPRRRCPPLAFVRVYGPADRDIVVRTGAQELRLRVAESVEARPRISPDGSHVAFVSERGGTWRVCVIPSSGGEAVCVGGHDVERRRRVGAPTAQASSSAGAERLFSVPYEVETTQTAGPEVDLGIAVPGGSSGPVAGRRPDRGRRRAPARSSASSTGRRR